jgi:hypothetical protein
MCASAPDLFDRLAAIDWGDRFDTFSADEQQVLALYHALAQELGQHDFFAEPQRLSVGADDDGSYERVEHAGPHVLRSMTMVFRQMWSKREPAQASKVLSVLRRHAVGPSTVSLLDEIGEHLRAAGRRELMKHVWIDDPMGTPKQVFRAAEVIDDWLYSGAFHTDLDKKAKVAGWSAASYEGSLIKGIADVAAVMWELDIVVGGVLEAVAVST